MEWMMDGWRNKKGNAVGVCVYVLYCTSLLGRQKIGNSLQGICPRASNETFLKYKSTYMSNVIKVKC
jgi:hypothetical protein